METLGKISWLVPALPLAGSLLVIFLLIIFNRTINRLTKPISIFLIACVSISTIFCITLLVIKTPEQSQEINFIFSFFKFNFVFFINNTIEKVITVLGSTALAVLIWSFYSLKRRTGYIRYFSSVTAFSGIIFLLIIGKIIPLPFLGI